jgi:hypothetical protein
MSSVGTRIPPLIEQQLLLLDKQIRDTAFIRGAAQTMLGVCVFLGLGLLLDGLFALNTTTRECLLAGWFLLVIGLLWRGIVRPAITPVSLASLAAIIEKQFPELRERLTSLVELRGSEATDLAPGASKLMQDLLARQTLKAFDKVEIDGVASHRGPLKAVMAGAACVLLLIAPFAWNGEGYSLLWSRFFIPWGNFGWGTRLSLKVDVADPVVARGSDVPIRVTVIDRRRNRPLEKNSTDPIWLNWRDGQLTSDRRRLEWDDASDSFLTILPRIQNSVAFDISTTGAKSGVFKIDVADPPVISQFKMMIEPAAYTGEPARSLAGIPAEVMVSEFSRIQLQLEFQQPVIEAELTWPAAQPREGDHPAGRVDSEQNIPFELSGDRRSATAQVIVSVGGPFSIGARNSAGLRNREQPRSLIVTLDEPPQLKLSGSDEPVLVRPDDILEQLIEVHDDYGLSTVELHLETSTGINHVERVTEEQRREPDLSHTFKVDLAPFSLSGGQIVTYRVRAVDNRPRPGPNEVWSGARMLMINTSLRQIPDQRLSSDTKSLDQDIESLKSELKRSKDDLAKLPDQIEKEALNRRPETDKNDRLQELQQAQDRLIERLQELGDRLADRPMTRELAPLAEQIANENLQAANDRLEQSKNQASRDQLEPVAQAIDRVGNAERQLQQLERQLNELNKLEQDLSELNRIAQRAENVADQLDKLDDGLNKAAQQKKSDNNELAKSDPAVTAEDPGTSVKDGSLPQQANADSTERQASNSEKASPEGSTEVDPDDVKTLQRLKNEGKKLADQMSELLKKHPELLETARRERQDQLSQLADQARQLAEPQERLADVLREAVADAPAVASRPENVNPTNAGRTQNPDKRSSRPIDEKGDRTTAEPNKRETADLSSNDSAKSDSGAEKSESEKSVSQKMSEPQPRVADGSNSVEKHSPPRQEDPLRPGETAAQKQEQLAREATQQALQLAREIGADAPATKAAAEFARQADAARQNAQSGKLDEAAKSAKAAQQSAQETSRELNPDDQSSSPLAGKSRELAEKQREAAEQLSQLSKSPDAARGAQVQGQRRLAETADRIAEQFDRVAKDLKSDPLNAAKPAESGERARDAARQAQEAMKKAEEANRQNDTVKSAQAATDAAEQLKQAAEQIKPAPPSMPQSTPIPKKIGSQVTEAMKKMSSAQNQLSECNCQNPSASGSKSSSRVSSGGQVSKSNSSAPSSNPSKSESGPSSPQTSSEPTAKSEAPSTQEGEKSANGKDGQISQNEGKPNGKPGNGDSSAKQPMATNDPSLKDPGKADDEGRSDEVDPRREAESPGKSSGIAQAAEKFRELAELLRGARADSKANSESGQRMRSQQTAQAMPADPQDRNPEPGEPGQSGNSAAGTNSVPDLSHLDTELQQQARSNWGRLPGHLRTEILQGAAKKSHPEYTERIKSYFDQITKPAK